ncbi:hypothetical protein BC629DRAFT_1531391 [Irpex lacteus]|nr:hypothetical protein BC629DRAFT_1531391 [Irpex lacteus]
MITLYRFTTQHTTPCICRLGRLVRTSSALLVRTFNPKTAAVAHTPHRSGRVVSTASAPRPARFSVTSPTRGV